MQITAAFGDVIQIFRPSFGSRSVRLRDFSRDRRRRPLLRVPTGARLQQPSFCEEWSSV
jgi:hypothetical protein